MYLFILESIGTSELILIGIVALIVFGPRKLPQIARTIGKTMADFRKTTNEFKSTWEKEVNFEESESQNKQNFGNLGTVENSIQRETKQMSDQNLMLTPEIKEVSQTDIEKLLATREQEEEKELVKTPHTEKNSNDKRSWL